MENNYFISALENYIKAKANKKECYYMDTNRVNYMTLTDFMFTDMIICNNIVAYNDNGSNWDIELGYDYDYDEETGEYTDIYQYYIVNVDNWRLEEYKKYLQETKKESDLILYYDNELDVYILGVSHYGTSWDYVPTEIKIAQDKE